MVAGINKPFSQKGDGYFFQDCKQLGAALHEKEISVLPNPTGWDWYGLPVPSLLPMPAAPSLCLSISPS